MVLVVALDDYGADHSVEQHILDPVGALVEAVVPDGVARARQLHDAVGVFVVDTAIDTAFFRSAPACRIVATYGVGTDNIDLDAARKAGVAVTNVPDYCTDEVAEHAIGLWLACERRIVQGDRIVRSGGWEDPGLEPLRRLRGLTFGLVGFGRIARQVAQRVDGFGCSLIAYDPFIDPFIDPVIDPSPGQGGPVELVGDLKSLLSAADVVSLHVPLTEKTTGLIDATAIDSMKASSVLINTARGGLIHEPALLAALRSGRLAAAGLDVLSDEPPDRSFAGRDLDNLVLTPHIAFSSTESLIAARQGAAEAIAQAVAGKPIRNRVA